MNTKILTSIIVSLSFTLTNALASVPKKKVYVPVLTPAQQTAVLASSEASIIAGQLQPMLPSKNYGRVTKDIKEYWDGKNLIHEVIKDLTKQEKAELCNDLALALNNTGFYSQIPLLLHSGGFLTGPTSFNFREISAECKSVLFNNFMYSLIKTGCYQDVPLLSNFVGYWNGSTISPGHFTKVGINFKAELYANLACSLAKISAYEELQKLMFATTFWNKTSAPALSLVHVSSPAAKAALCAALSCSFISSANYPQLIDLVARPWGYFNGITFVAKAITSIPEPYKSTIKNILEIGFMHTGRSNLIPNLKKL